MISKGLLFFCMNRILLIQTAFLGDVILATPVLEVLHTRFPDAKIDILVRKGSESLFTHHPFLNEVLVWEKRQLKYFSLIRLIRVVRYRRYDLVVNLQRFLSTGLITALSAARETVGFDKNPLSFLFTHEIKHELLGVHEVARNLRTVERWVGTHQIVRPVLYPDSFEIPRELFEKKFLCIAPGSVWFTKQWPLENWVDFIHALDAHWHIVLLGSNEDFMLCETIRLRTPDKIVLNLAGKLTLLQSASVMKKAHMNYVNDSAPLHLASAINAPVTAIYCSTVPEFGFSPLSDQSFMIQTKSKLPCRPCGIHGKRQCPKGHFHCSAIDISQLLATLG